MSIKTIEINDLLPDAIAQAIDELKGLIKDYYIENPDTDDLCLSDHIDYDGRFHEMVDSNVPIYTYDIKCAWFLHDTDLEEAYENAGIGENPRENSGMTAIYCLIEQECHEWFSDNNESIQAQWGEFRDGFDGGITSVSESEYYTKCASKIEELND